MPRSVDEITLSVGGIEIRDFSGYSLDSDLFAASDSFSFSLSEKRNEIQTGKMVQVRVNGKLEMTGVIDRITQSSRKDGREVTVAGRDLMGLLCDHYCEDFGENYSLDGKTLRQIAMKIIESVPFINRQDIIFEGQAAKYDRAYSYGKVEPGSTVFDVLKRCAQGRGLIFYSMPDGTFVFGRPKSRGTALFSVNHRKDDPAANNAIDAELIDDISQAFSKVIVIAQVQGESDFGLPETVNVKDSAEMSDADFPFYKPQVIQHNGDNIAPKALAQATIEQHLARMMSLKYTVPGHSYNGSNWTVNELCHVNDNVFVKRDGGAITGDYLVYGRTFELSKQNGRLTRARLCKPGIVLEQ